MTVLTRVSSIGRQSQCCSIGSNANFTTKGSILLTLYKNRFHFTPKSKSSKCPFQTFRIPFALALRHINMGKTIVFPGLNPFQKVKFNFSTKNVFDVNRNIIQDVLIYSNKNESFFKTLSYVGVFQMLVWGYLGIFAVQDLKVAPKQDTSDLPFWKRLLYKEGQYKNAISILSVVVGFTILFITASYPRRAIKSLCLLRGGKDVKITTFSWLGREITFTTPVEHINCMEARTGAGLYIPLQIKNKYFFFLVDKKGQFHNTDLFDFLIGIKRTFK